MNYLRMNLDPLKSRPQKAHQKITIGHQEGIPCKQCGKIFTPSGENKCPFCGEKIIIYLE